MSLPPSFFDHLEDRLNLAVYDINESHRMGQADLRARQLLERALATMATTKPEPKMSVTGAKFLAEQIRNQLAATKSQLAQAGSEMQGAMSDLQATADEATKQVKEIQAETADLKAALGLGSNGAPE